MGHPNGIPPQPPYQYPMQYQPGYQPYFVVPTAQGYPAPQSPYGMQPPVMPAFRPVAVPSPMSMPAPPVPREKKILSILDPNSQQAIDIPEIRPASNNPSNNPTPNATVDTEHASEDARMRFREQVAQLVGSDPKPVAQSEPKQKPMEVRESKCLISREVVSLDVFEHLSPDDLAKPTIKINAQPSVIPSSEPADDAELAGQHDVSMFVAPEGFDCVGLSASVTNLTEDTEYDELEPLPEDAEEEERRAREEADEALRLRERELQDRLNEYEANKLDCDERTGFYSSRFMHCVGDYETEFKKTTPTVTLEQITEFGLDLESMPKDVKKVSEGGYKQGQKKYPGRSPVGDHRIYRGGPGSGQKKPYKSFNQIERAAKATLQNRAGNAWKAEKMRPEDKESEEAKVMALLKSVRSILNKITPTYKDDLIKEFLKLEVSGHPPKFAAPSQQLPQVIDIIFEKAVEEPRFCGLYSEICKRQVEWELTSGKSKGGTGSPFRSAILNRAQHTFVSKTFEADKKAIEEETDEEKKKALVAKFDEDFTKFRRRKFGNIHFIGQLFEHTLLSAKIIQWCCHDLLRHSHPVDGVPVPPPYDEESVQCATQLLEVVGKLLENSKDWKEGKAYCKQVVEHLNNIAANCSPKIKFKIMGLVDLQRSQWKQRKVVEQGPKKIHEIHKEIQQEQQQLIQERDAYERKISTGVRQQSNSFRKNAPPPRNSYDARTNNPQIKRAAATIASKQTPTTTTPRLIQPLQSGNPTPLKKSWKTGASGGGMTEGPGSRIIIQRQTGNTDGHRKVERDSVIAAVREVNGNPAHRSSSQVSGSSQEETKPTDEQLDEARGKAVRAINTLFEELAEKCTTEEEVIDELLSLNKKRFTCLSLRDLFRSFIQCFIEMKEACRPDAIKILIACMAKDGDKEAVVQGIVDFCNNSVEIDRWEEYPKLWDVLADLIVNLLVPTFEANSPEDPSTPKSIPPQLNDFSDAFVDASKDTRRPYSLLVQTLKRMAEELAKRSKDNLAGLSFDFDELKCLEKMDSSTLDTALMGCNVDVIGYHNLYDILRS